MALDSLIIVLAAALPAFIVATLISRRKAGFPFGLLAFVMGVLAGFLIGTVVLLVITSAGQDIGFGGYSSSAYFRRIVKVMLWPPIWAGLGIWRGRKKLKEKLEKSRLNEMSQQLKAAREKEENLATQEHNKQTAQLAKPDQSVATLVSADATDDDLYAIAWKEIENNDQEKGLWARLYAEHSGNSELLRTAYLKLRVEELGKQREIEKNKPPPPEDRGEAIKFDVEKETLHRYSAPDPTKKWVFFGIKFRHHPLVWFFGILIIVVVLANLSSI